MVAHFSQNSEYHVRMVAQLRRERMVAHYLANSPLGIFIRHHPWVVLLMKCVARTYFAPCKIIPQMCAPVARPPVCVSPTVSVIPTHVPSTPGNLDQFVCPALLRALPFREFLSSLSCRVVCPFLLILTAPSPTNPSEQAMCFFVLIQRFRSLSQISSILSCQQCW